MVGLDAVAVEQLLEQKLVRLNPVLVLEQFVVPNSTKIKLNIYTN